MKQTVNERVKLLRSSLKLSQIEFAIEIGVSASLLSKIEAGEKPSQHTVDLICEKYSVPETWLNEGKGEMAFKKPVTKEPTSDPYKDVLYKELKEQIAFYRDLLKQMAGGKPNFHKALNYTGLIKRSQLRVSRHN